MTDTPAITPAITLGAVALDTDDPPRLAAFWAALTGGEIAGEADGMLFVQGPPGGFSVLVRPRQGPAPEHPDQHLDLTVAWGAREAQVARAVSLGAEHRWDVLDEMPWVRWTTLADPGGHLFCIAEHTPGD
ncbi:VOC family protein [Geodermatophilaceae bacterium NBWT11]|nr:VOC family protein [Geodermatophilaceae bacterium NBWT11]